MEVRKGFRTIQNKNFTDGKGKLLYGHRSTFGLTSLNQRDEIINIVLKNLKIKNNSSTYSLYKKSLTVKLLRKEHLRHNICLEV